MKLQYLIQYCSNTLASYIKIKFKLGLSEFGEAYLSESACAVLTV